MCRERFQQVFTKVQKSTSCHQKFVQVLINLYDEVPFDTFFTEFMQCIEILFGQNANKTKYFLERAMKFAAKFVTALTIKIEQNTTNSTSDNNERNLFLTSVIESILKYHNVQQHHMRVNACKFLTILMKAFGDHEIDNDLCDNIEEAMLERLLLDPKVNVRVEAINALTRLQQPVNNECPIIKAYLECLKDKSALIRRESMQSIAPSTATIPIIVRHAGDVDDRVRLAAFDKCALIGPKRMKIVDRHYIMLRGFTETNKNVKTVFLQTLIPKWLLIYERNFLKFYLALKLDGTEDDVQQTNCIYEHLMIYFLKHHPVKDIIECLPLDSDHLIPVDNVNLENVLYWCLLIKQLRKSCETEEFVEETLPELAPFCAYIEKLFDKSFNEKIEHWEYISYQYILWNLLETAENYDLNDEVGRQHLRKLQMKIISKKCVDKLVDKAVNILAKLSSNIKNFIDEMCVLISDIREPLIEEEVQLGKDERLQKDFELAQLSVKKNILREQKDEAISKSEFEEVIEIQKQLSEIEEQIAKINTNKQTVVTKKNRDDVETTSHCLNILISVLKLPNAIITSSLVINKNEFVMPLLNNCTPELYVKVLTIITLFGVTDKTVAAENIKYLIIPFFAYHMTTVEDKSIIRTAVAGITDLIRLHGPEIVNTKKDEANTNATRRRLYQLEEFDDADLPDIGILNIQEIVEIYLEMFADEDSALRYVAGDSLMELMREGIIISAPLLSKLIVKWLNPITAIQEPKLLNILGVGIKDYVENIVHSEEVIVKTIILTLYAITNAPHSSTSVGIDIDKAVNFLIALISVKKTALVHYQNLANELCNIMSSKPEEIQVPVFAKMLANIDLTANDVWEKELIVKVENVLNVITSKSAQIYMKKFLIKLQNVKLKSSEANKSYEQVNATPALMENNSNENLNIETDSSENTNNNDSVERNNRLSLPNENDNSQMSSNSEDITRNSQVSEVNPNNSSKISRNNDCITRNSRLSKSNIKDKSQNTKNCIHNTKKYPVLNVNTNTRNSSNNSVRLTRKSEFSELDVNNTSQEVNKNVRLTRNSTVSELSINDSQNRRRSLRRAKSTSIPESHTNNSKKAKTSKLLTRNSQNSELNVNVDSQNTNNYSRITRNNQKSQLSLKKSKRSRNMSSSSEDSQKNCHISKKKSTNKKLKNKKYI